MYDVYDFSDMSWVNPPKRVKLQGNMSCAGWGLVNTREKGVANNNERNSMKKIERKFIDTTNPYPVNTSSTK